MDLYKKRYEFKTRLRNRERIFGGWLSYSHPSIAETLSMAGFDFIGIDMEHTTINLEQAQRIIAACQAEGCLCLPRPVSHSNDWIKPLLESGADGIIIQMVNSAEDVKELLSYIKFPPRGNRSYGVNRAHGYGLDFHRYVNEWNDCSSFIIQVESIEAVNNIDELLDFEDVDGVMIGPYDISGSLGVPSQTSHPKVIEASKKVIKACEKWRKSCGTQVSVASMESVQQLFDQGYTYAILESDLFILSNWTENMKKLIERLKNEKI